MICDVN